MLMRYIRGTRVREDGARTIGGRVRAISARPCRRELSCRHAAALPPDRSQTIRPYNNIVVCRAGRVAPRLLGRWPARFRRPRRIRDTTRIMFVRVIYGVIDDRPTDSMRRTLLGEWCALPTVFPSTIHHRTTDRRLPARNDRIEMLELSRSAKIARPHVPGVIRQSSTGPAGEIHPRKYRINFSK